MLKAKSVAKVAITAGLAFGLIAAGASTAQADPNPAGFRTYAAVGSDTIQDLYNGLSNGYTAGGAVRGPFASSIASYDAFGSATIQTKSGGATFNRPAGSGDGVKALSASYNPAKNFFADASGVNSPSLQTGGVAQVDIARSSSRPSAAVPSTDANNKLTFVPLARDAVSVAIQTAGLTGNGIPTNFTTAELTAIYQGGTAGRITASGTGSTDPVYTSGTTTFTIHPELPQLSSGTRSFFLKSAGVTAIGSWVEQGATTPENSAQSIDSSGDVSPFSAAQWIAQKNLIAPTTFAAPAVNFASLQLAAIDGNAPFTAGSTAPNLTPGALYGSATAAPVAGVGTFARDVYSVVPTANYAAQATLLTDTLRNARYTSGGVTKYVVQDFGFLRISGSGYTGSNGQVFSNWTN